MASMSIDKQYTVKYYIIQYIYVLPSLTMHPRATTNAFYDPATGTVTYVVSDPVTRHAAVIDPVLDFDAKSGHTGTDSADRVLAYLQAQGLTLDWILETHAHADHLTAAPYVKRQAGGRIAIGERIREVQASFKKLFNLERSFLPDGSQFDHLFQDGERFHIGELEATALWVPGHTPADMAYAVDGAVFVGDTLFMPDVGSARADFPGGDAKQLYRSIRRLLALPPQTTLYVCHDYPPPPPPGALANHSGRTADPQPARARGYRRGDIRRDAQRARCNARGAAVDPAVDPGQCACRLPAAGRGQWRGLPEDPPRCAARARLSPRSALTKCQLAPTASSPAAAAS
jgi:glyoxylase-like metal-dependent hydrolase (beta-lactamase superfamily II)